MCTMLIRNSMAEKKAKVAGNARHAKVPDMNMGVTAGSVAGRTSRKVLRVCPAKRSPAAPLTRAPSSGKKQRSVPRLPPDAMDPCDNSNDSGLGFEHTSQFITVSPNSLASLDTIMDESRDIDDIQPRIKRSRLAVKAERSEDEETDTKFVFSSPLRQLKDAVPPPIPLLPLSGTVCSTTKDGRVTLSISSQPEQQHRARYQTEGSRGALSGYDKPARLQVFIGSDVERVSPHMFYQACKVCGKNSTPCTEQKVEGTVVIELQFDPAKKMIVTCDCVGILKERNVDVEHRFPDETVSRSKKKSTRCRMVFRTCVERPNGSWETLQVVSQAIACTQLPGVPEICKKSLSSSPANGGSELFILGKNFLKDSRVVFQQPLPSSAGTSGKTSYVWEDEVTPDKEFLQPTHLVCVVPPFHRQDLSEPVTVRLFVRSSGKCSEPQTFLYLPTHNTTPTPTMTNKSQPAQQSASSSAPVQS
ncbi:hypothetical protein B566_EDAN001681 [Ephemera danica]|nr:hypothetical protein B566_EDAN001681 [Ephemera danica]